MGFYHHLRVHTATGSTDVGGYSKGGSKNTWFFAFSPTEYENNLEELIGTENVRDAKVGYKTTVGKAVERLQKIQTFLPTVQGHLMLREHAHFHSDAYEQVHELLIRLKGFEPNDTLVLDQRDGTSYSMKFDKEKPFLILDLEDWWYSNSAAAMGEQLYLWKLENVHLKAVIQSFADGFVNKETNEFFDYLVEGVAHNERSYGPSEVSEYLEIRNQEHRNNPHKLFFHAAYHFVDYYKLKVNEVDGFCKSDSPEAVSLMSILLDLEYQFGEALDMLSEYQKN